MTNLLDHLVHQAEVDLERRKQATPASELRERLDVRGRERPFREALVRSGLSLIAEFKRRSPSAGDINPSADLAQQIRAYERGGAAAISVVTDAANFKGSVEDLSIARSACDLPILRKDFILDPYQLLEAATFGADAVLLMASILVDEHLVELLGQAGHLDLDCIVEVRDEDELTRALELGVDVIGINHRDFPEGGRVDASLTLELMPDIPAGKTVVAESGISDPSQLDELDRVGVDAVLIGEALMRAADPEARTREFVPDEESTREQLLP